jgi:hypothetical protein
MELNNNFDGRCGFGENLSNFPSLKVWVHVGIAAAKGSVRWSPTVNKCVPSSGDAREFASTSARAARAKETP